MSSESSNSMYNQSYGEVNSCYPTNQSLTLHSELNQLKMSNIRPEDSDSSCPLHASTYSSSENYQSNFSTALYHQSSTSGYHTSNNSYNNISSTNTQTHHNELQLPIPSSSYPIFDYNTSNMEHGSVTNSNIYHQTQSISTPNNSVMDFTNDSSNNYKNRPQVQAYSKIPPVRSSQDNFVTPKVK